MQRMLASRFTPRAMLGTDRRLGELADDIQAVEAPYYRVEADAMAEVVGFHLNRGVLASASRPPELTVAQVLDDARTVAVLEGFNHHENLGSATACYLGCHSANTSARSPLNPKDSAAGFQQT